MYIHVCMYIYIYIYIYLSLSLSIYIYISMYGPLTNDRAVMHATSYACHREDEIIRNTNNE